jgi:hypothetical protein
MDIFDDCRSLPGSKDPLADPQAEKMWSRCGGAPAIVKWRARFSMSAVDRELHELELELTGARRRTCDRMAEKEKTARYFFSLPHGLQRKVPLSDRTSVTPHTNFSLAQLP